MLALYDDDVRLEKVTLTKNSGETLLAYPEGEFKKLKEQIEALPHRSPEGRLVRHIFISQSFELILDRQGRIVIPKLLREHAHLSGDIVLVGTGNKFEMWSKKKWDAYQQLIEENYKAIINTKAEDAVSELGVKFDLT